MALGRGGGVEGGGGSSGEAEEEEKKWELPRLEHPFSAPAKQARNLSNFGSAGLGTQSLTPSALESDSGAAAASLGVVAAATPVVSVVRHRLIICFHHRLLRPPPALVLHLIEGVRPAARRRRKIGNQFSIGEKETDRKPEMMQSFLIASCSIMVLSNSRGVGYGLIIQVHLGSIQAARRVNGNSIRLLVADQQDEEHRARPIPY
ncbi:uncharacterized protein [Triticum aestivum]|uniref:uncharacterized protein n=1 Tax=Triticum aestivum TaxID=4565 RepID=UPI001D002EE1|nr:uncharacterized protein LOC123138955 [Triticum aestivum]